MPETRADTPDFYVGYLPVPLRLRRFLRWAVPITLWLVCGVGAIWAFAQRSPGNAVWEDQTARTFSGTLVAKPYPILFASNTGEGMPGPMLIVEVGKIGGARASSLNLQHTSLSGWSLSRAGRTMIELQPGDDAFPKPDAHTPTPAASSATWTRVGRVTLRGEIVDSKCFLGAMKPGEGKTHKACATLCIRGGIPPSFVTLNAQGERSYFLLTNEAGDAMDSELLPFIADAIELSGEEYTLSTGAPGQSLRVLRVKPSDVRRL